MSRAPSRAEPERRLVGFHVGEGRYGVDVPAVTVVLQAGAPMPNPWGTPILPGVTEHDGRVVPLLDLRRCLGLSPMPANRKQKWVIVRAGDLDLGLMVDAALGVIRVVASDERPVPALGQGATGAPVRAAWSHQGGLLMELDLDALAGLLRRELPRGGEAGA